LTSYQQKLLKVLFLRDPKIFADAQPLEYTEEPLDDSEVDLEFEKRYDAEMARLFTMENKRKLQLEKPPKYKPLYFQISPNHPGYNQIQHYCDLMFSVMQEYVAPNGLGFYGGGNTGDLNYTLKTFIDSNAEYPGPLVIAINAPGTKNNGNFKDNNFTWDPKKTLEWIC